MASNEEPKYVHNSEFNRKLLKFAELYGALLKIQLKSSLQDLKNGARSLAYSTDNPKLKQACEKLETLELK